MRSIHLLFLAALLCALVAGLWTVVGASGRGVAAGDRTANADGSAHALDPGDAPRAAEDVSGNAAPGRVPVAAEPAPPDPAQAAAEARRRVHGRVTRPDGTGAAGARVWASTSEFWARLPLDLEPEALPARWIRVERTTADEEGRFEFVDLEPGRLRLAARAPGFAPAYREGLEVPRRDEVELADVRLEPGVAVEGAIVGPDGRPAAGVRILIAADSLVRGGGLSIPGRGADAGASDAEGKFRVDELAPGPWHLLFLGDDAALAEAEGRTERAGEVVRGLVVRLEAGVAITGRVLVEEGALPDGLRVQARQGGAGREGEDESGAEEAHGPGVEARPRTALVGADGAFAIHGLRAGADYRITLAQRRGETWRGLSGFKARDARAPASGLELRMRPDAALVLRVVDDATGAPVEECVVWAGSGRLRVLRDEKNEVQRRFEDGRVRYPDLPTAPNSKPIVLRVSAAGYADEERKNLRIAPGSDLDLGEVRLKPEKRVTVLVLDDAGQPVPNARVLLSARPLTQLMAWSRYPPEQDLWGELQARFARTGPDGRCVLSSLPETSALAMASARGFLPSEAATVMLAKDRDIAVELRLRRGATVRVRVSDGQGRPVAGVPVGHKLPRRAGESEEEREDARSTAADGEVRYESLEPGVHAFRVEQEGGDAAWWNEEEQNAPPEAPWFEVNVPAGAGELTVDLVAPPRGTLTGEVREGGRPLEGAIVKLVPHVEGRGQGWTWAGAGADPFTATTDHTGAYRIEARRCGEYLALVTHSERRMAAEFRVHVTPGESRVDFTLDVNGIEGRVVDPGGMPIVGVEISVDRAEPGLEMEPPHQMVVAEDDRGNPSMTWRQRGPRAARTDSAGRYVLRGLLEETPLHVAANSPDAERRVLEPITLAPGEIRRNADFVLRRAGRIQVSLGGSLGDGSWYPVHVLERDGQELRRVRMSWMANWNRNETIGSLVPGRYVVRLLRRDQQGAETVLSETEVDVEVGQASTVALQVP